MTRFGLRHLWLVDDHANPSWLGEQLRIWIGVFQGTDPTWAAGVLIQGVLSGFDRLVIGEARDPGQIADLCQIIAERGPALRNAPNAVCIIAPFLPPLLPATLEVAGFRVKISEVTVL